MQTKADETKGRVNRLTAMRVRRLADRDRRDAATGVQTDLVHQARTLANQACLTVPGADPDALASELINHGFNNLVLVGLSSALGLPRPAKARPLSLALALSLAGHTTRADRARDATETAVGTGTARQASAHDRPRRSSRLSARAKARQVARLVTHQAPARLARPTAGIGLACLVHASAPDRQAKARARCLADLVRHQAVLPGAWQGPTPRGRRQIRNRDLTAFRGLALVLGVPVPVVPDLATLTDAAGPIGRRTAAPMASVVAAILADGTATRVDPDAARWYESATGQVGQATDRPRTKARRVARADSEVSPGSRFPSRDALAGHALTPADLARHQVGQADACKAPVVLVREAPLARMLDKRRLSATRTDATDAAASPLSGGWAGAKTDIRWRAFSTWQAPTDGRGAVRRVALAIEHANHASLALTLFARLSLVCGASVPADALALAPITVGRLAARFVQGDQVNYSAACRSVGLPTDATHRAALASLVRQAADHASGQVARPTGAVPGRPGQVMGRRAKGRRGQVAAVRDAKATGRCSPADLADLAGRIAAPTTDALSPADLATLVRQARQASARRQADQASRADAWQASLVRRLADQGQADAPAPVAPRCRCLVCLARNHQADA